MAQETIPALVREKPGNMRAVPGFPCWVPLGSPPGFPSGTCGLSLGSPSMIMPRYFRRKRPGPRRLTLASDYMHGGGSHGVKARSQGDNTRITAPKPCHRALVCWRWSFIFVGGAFSGGHVLNSTLQPCSPVVDNGERFTAFLDRLANEKPLTVSCDTVLSLFHGSLK